jgi:hypothetical protein
VRRGEFLLKARCTASTGSAQVQREGYHERRRGVECLGMERPAGKELVAANVRRAMPEEEGGRASAWARLPFPME